MDPLKIKQHYNEKIKESPNYERERWFADDIKRSGYDMTLSAIRRHVLPVEFSSCLELGPGAGTWTKELLAARPDARFDLVDISKEMLGLVRRRFADKHNINYFESDFLAFDPEKQYDFFFSSRAIEYIPDKDAVARKICALIKPGGRGFIITKTPKYLRNKILGRAIPEMHRGQIAPGKFAELLAKYGAEDIAVYPAAMSWPFWRSAKMNLMLYQIFGGRKLNFFSKFFAESYAIGFNKTE